MIDHGAFAVEPWCLRETELDLSMLAQSESVFALSNGHIGWRANLDEGEPHGLPGSYLNGVYEIRPMPYAELAYGQPESGQTVINVTNGKLIRLFVNDEPFDVRYGELRSHHRMLDFRAGALYRTAEWVSPDGHAVHVTTTRVVSFTQRAVAAICYEVTPIDAEVRVTVQSELLANESLPQAADDPRVAAALNQPLQCEHSAANNATVVLVHRTKRSGLRVGAAMDHIVDGPPGVLIESKAYEDTGLFTATTPLKPGERLRVVKFVAYGWSGQRSLPAVRDQVWAAISGAKQSTWDGLLTDQRAFLDDFWARADVEVDGDTEVQQAVRFGLFHVLQAGVRGENRPIPAKGLTGPGYDGHAFWDTETYVLPLLNATLPDAAGSALRWRHSTMSMAKDRAAQLGLAGAAFPWRTIVGAESSGYWPAGTAAFHINADIAEAAVRYVCASGDKDFEAGPGFELLTETARLWRSLGHHDSQGQFHIDGVTGPDEYSAISDDNVFTNLMAKRNLLAAAAVVDKYPERARDLGVDAEEAAGWQDAARDMHIPYDESLGVHPAADKFTRYQAWDFVGTPPDKYPLLLHYTYFDLYRKQVVKQADLVLAMFMCGREFTDEQKVRNFQYYEAITVRDSSLSASIQSIMAAETGHVELAYDYLGEAALMDLDDLEHNTKDGVHIASLAGAWLALVCGFGGMRHDDAGFRFAPRLPEGLARLAFNLMVTGRHLHVEVTPRTAKYSLADGEPLTITHHGDEITLASGKPQEVPIPPCVPRSRPRQPPGREPAHRRPRV